jgi:hypothetical protein
MKKVASVFMALGLVGLLITQTGCFGSFGLTKKVYSVNKKSGDKIVQEAVFLLFCIIPVYEVSCFIDAIFLNTIEFWTGSNPLAMSKTDKEEQYVTNNGQQYRIVARQNQFEIKNMATGQMVFLVYCDNSWYVTSNGKIDKMATINDEFVEIFNSGKLVAKKDIASMNVSK